jgi:hypothetical protein
MHHFFTIARIYPYWAFPLAIVLAELGIFFKRRKNSTRSYFCWASVVVLGIGFFLWFYYRGDLNSDQWVRSMVE